MSEVRTERLTAEVESEFVVFLIGMRFNRVWKVWRWGPVALAMARMLRELEADPGAGFLGVEAWPGRTTLMLQYWRSFEALERYATDAAREHRPAWTAFNRAVGSTGDVGIWHETYRCGPVTTSASTTTCRCSASRRRRARCRRRAPASPRQAV